MLTIKHAFSADLTCDFGMSAGSDVRLVDRWAENACALDELDRRRLMTDILPSCVIKLFIGGFNTVSIYFDMITPKSPHIYAMCGRRLWGRSPSVEHARNLVKLTREITAAL